MSTDSPESPESPAPIDAQLVELEHADLARRVGVIETGLRDTQKKLDELHDELDALTSQLAHTLAELGRRIAFVEGAVAPSKQAGPTRAPDGSLRPASPALPQKQSADLVWTPSGWKPAHASAPSKEKP